MSLNWEWKNKLGSVKLVETFDGKPKRFKIDLYTCNGLFVACYHYKDDNGRAVYDLVNFACDKEHFKRCLGLVKGYENLYRKTYQYYTAWRLNTYFNEAWIIAELLIKAGFTVHLYSKPPKEKKAK